MPATTKPAKWAACPILDRFDADSDDPENQLDFSPKAWFSDKRSALAWAESHKQPPHHVLPILKSRTPGPQCSLRFRDFLPADQIGTPDEDTVRRAKMMYPLGDWGPRLQYAATWPVLTYLGGKWPIHEILAQARNRPHHSVGGPHVADPYRWLWRWAEELEDKFFKVAGPVTAQDIHDFWGSFQTQLYLKRFTIELRKSCGPAASGARFKLLENLARYVDDAQIQGVPGQSEEVERGHIRSEFLNGFGVSDLGLSERQGAPSYKTIRRYRSGVKSNQDLSVRQRLAEILNCPLSEVPE
jgi:hypothetical protein